MAAGRRDHPAPGPDAALDPSGRACRRGAGLHRVERGPLVYCFEQADQRDGVRVDDLAVRPGSVLGERPVTLPGIGQTIEVTAAGVHLPAAVPVTAVAIPYFQWDNRDGHAMRVWIPRAAG